MASILGSFMRLVFKSSPHDGRPDVEVGGAQPVGNAAPVPSSPTMGATIDAASSYQFGLNGQRAQRIPNNDTLTTFRIMMGITSSPYLGFSQQSRPAPNIGIYARVIYAEQKAKDSFKIYSLLINCCYFLQIVVAAALTAMGAANASGSAITAFGAINTIMAGLLTFLKGSGLPARYKYYDNEWKKIREFIEVKEREFARDDCVLDVYEVVAVVQRMYNNVKQEIEINTPDSYTSITNNARMVQDAQDKIGGVLTSKLGGWSEKAHESKDSAARRLAEGAEKQSQLFVDELRHGEKHVEKLASGVEKQSHGFLDELRQGEKQIRSQVLDSKSTAEKLATKADHLSRELLDDLRQSEKQVEQLASGTERQSRGLLDDLRQTGKKIESHIRKLEGSAEKEIERFGEDVEHKARQVQQIGDVAAADAEKVLHEREDVQRHDSKGKNSDDNRQGDR